MGSNLTLAFGSVLGLAALAGFARSLSAPGARRNALSVALVALSLVAAFLFFFGLGTFVRARQAPPKLQSHLWTPGASAAREQNSQRITIEGAS